MALDQTKKEAILSAAVRAFARYGFKKAAIEEIAKDAGVAKGTVYLACDSKEDLFYQAVHRELRAWVSEIAKLVDPRAPADQLLLHCAMAGFKYLEDHSLVRQLLFGDYLLLLPEWHERLEALRALGRGVVTEILKLGIQQKIFRPDLDVDEVARIAQDFEISSWVYIERSKLSPEAIQRRFTVGLDLLMNGLKT